MTGNNAKFNEKEMLNDIITTNVGEKKEKDDTGKTIAKLFIAASAVYIVFTQTAHPFIVLARIFGLLVGAGFILCGAASAGKTRAALLAVGIVIVLIAFPWANIDMIIGGIFLALIAVGFLLALSTPFLSYF